MSQTLMLMLLPTIVDYLHAQKRDVWRMFIRHSSLVKHLDGGKHKLYLEYETLYARAMIEYATNLEWGASKCPAVLEGIRTSLPTVSTTLPMEWALSRRTKFTDNQNQYLNSKF